MQKIFLPESTKNLVKDPGGAGGGLLKSGLHFLPDTYVVYNVRVKGMDGYFTNIRRKIDVSV